MPGPWEKLGARTEPEAPAWVLEVLEVSGSVSSLGFLLASPDSPPEASPVLFLTAAFLSHCWWRYLETRMLIMIGQSQGRKLVWWVSLH